MMRRRAFAAALQAHGLVADQDLVVVASGYSVPAGRQAAETLFARRKRFSAVVAANDQFALGILDGAAAAGLHVPGDFSLIGFNDMPLVDRIDPPLTTLRIQHYEMGAVAVRILLEELAEPRPESRTVMLTPRLIVRGSTGQAAD